MMLPGRAMVTVHERPELGLNTLVGFDVSSSSPLDSFGVRSALRFCRDPISVRLLRRWLREKIPLLHVTTWWIYRRQKFGALQLPKSLKSLIDSTNRYCFLCPFPLRMGGSFSYQLLLGFAIGKVDALGVDNCCGPDMQCSKAGGLGRCCWRTLVVFQARTARSSP